MSKGSKQRPTNLNKYVDNFDEINWKSKKEKKNEETNTAPKNPESAASSQTEADRS